EVAIRAEASNGAFTVAVCDTGPGISAADQAKIFEEFQQADSSITRKKGGTGLGLSIAKRIIEMHGGPVLVEIAAGDGSEVCFPPAGGGRSAGEASRGRGFPGWAAATARLGAERERGGRRPRGGA